MDILKYKGYRGSVEYSWTDGCLYGKVLDIRSTISYEGKNLDELQKDFEDVVDECLVED